MVAIRFVIRIPHALALESYSERRTGRASYATRDDEPAQKQREPACPLRLHDRGILATPAAPRHENRGTGTFERLRHRDRTGWFGFNFFVYTRFRGILRATVVGWVDPTDRKSVV